MVEEDDEIREHGRRHPAKGLGQVESPAPSQEATLHHPSAELGVGVESIVFGLAQGRSRQ